MCQQFLLNLFTMHPMSTKGKIMINQERLENLMKEKHLSRRGLERESGLGVGTITKWKTISPTVQNLQKVASALGVSVAYLTGESEFKTEQDALINKWNKQMAAGLPDEVRKIEAGIRIPVLGSVPCGIPTEAVEFLDAEDWEEISEIMSRSGNFFALKVKGDSMCPRIQQGDVLIIRSQDTADSGDIVIAKVNGEEACCKRLIRHQDGIVLESFNPVYPPMFFSNDEIIQKPVQIIGKVVENRQKM